MYKIVIDNMSEQPTTYGYDYLSLNFGPSLVTLDVIKDNDSGYYKIDTFAKNYINNVYSGEFSTEDIEKIKNLKLEYDKEQEKYFPITAGGGRRRSNKRSTTYRRRSSKSRKSRKARKSRKSRATRRR